MAGLHVIPFEHIFSEDPESCLVDVQLHDPYIGALVHKPNAVEGKDHLIVWNWRKGEAEMVSNSLFLCMVLVRVLLLT
jgi:hypothetical protein